MPALLAEAELTANWKLSLLEYVKAQAAAGVIGAASTLPSLIQPVQADSDEPSSATDRSNTHHPREPREASKLWCIMHLLP